MSDEQLTKKERKAQKKLEQEQHRQAEKEARRAAARKTWTITIIGAVVIAVFLGWLIQNAPERERIVDATPGVINEVDEAVDNIKGASPENAKLTLVEYSDFECPACGQYYPILKQLTETYSDDFRLVYRHLPIQTIHPNAALAARYAEAAGIQGQFFPMHDRIFETQGTWRGASARVAENTFKGIGEELGLDIEKLELDADSDAVRTKVEEQRLDAIGAGAQGTPSFFVDGARIASPPGNFADFEAFVLERINAANSNATEVPVLDVDVLDLEEAGVNI